MKLDYLQFSLIDYILFCGMLIVSALIGVYFGIYKKQNTTNDYLLGGKNMSVFPIAMSLAASYVSAITLLGMPAEMYYYNSQYSISCFGGILGAIIIGTVYLPVFYELRVTSSFEYLDMRFDRKARLTASFLCFFNFVMILPIVMYVPALAFNLVSGISITYVTPVICFVCIFYTTLGGLKAVVWTDTIQFIVMNGSIAAILMLGIPAEGGLQRIWKIAEDTGRVNFFDFDPNPYKRLTFWSIIASMTIAYTSHMGVNQLCIQRFLSVPTMEKAKKVLIIYVFAILLMKAFCLFIGFVILARYYGCDPLAAGIISKNDQILPYYVMDTTRNIPGLPGLFVAGVFSAALSSMSSYLNTICGVIYKDFISLYVAKDVSEERASNIMKLLNIVMGCLCMLAVFGIEKLGSVMQLTISFSGVSSGAMLGMFTMGMFFTRANSKGTIAGALSSIILLSIMMYGNSAARTSGYIRDPIIPLPTDKCEGNITTLQEPEYTGNAEEIFSLFRISPMWYYLIGLLTVFVVGLPISYMTEPPRPEQLKDKYFSPVIRKYISKHVTQWDDPPCNDTELHKLNTKCDTYSVVLFLTSIYAV